MLYRTSANAVEANIIAVTTASDKLPNFRKRPWFALIANPLSCLAVYQRKRAVSGTPPEIAQTLQIRIVFAEDGLCRKPP
jgi:hypothetical protein